MIVILIRRFVRADREPVFLERFKAQTPIQNPAFIKETLTRLSDDPNLPPRLRSLALNGPSCITYLNIAEWSSREAFEQEFLTKPSDFDEDIETAPRQRMVLDIVG
jgi:hypothetical protein